MKLDLEQTWIECLKMWHERVAVYLETGVMPPKVRYLKTHDFKFITADCFFCDYANHHGGCDKACPGKLIDKTFKCWNNEYHWLIQPEAFLTKIEKLNEERQLRGLGANV